MAPYARALLQFGFAAMAAGRRVEVFCFGTRLTRVTRTLRTKDPDRAMHEVGALVADWEGGTRIGEALKALLDGWSQRAARRCAARSSCCARTGWNGATPRCSERRWRGSAGSLTGWSGRTR